MTLIALKRRASDCGEGWPGAGFAAADASFWHSARPFKRSRGGRLRSAADVPIADPLAGAQSFITDVNRGTEGHAKGAWVRAVLA
jgi:hypothetical protein